MRIAVLVSVVLLTGCNLLFSTDDFAARQVFAADALRTEAGPGGPVWEGATAVVLVESREPAFQDGVTAGQITFRWREEFDGDFSDPRINESPLCNDYRCAFAVEIPPSLPLMTGEENRLEILIDDQSFGDIVVQGLLEKRFTDNVIETDDNEPLYSRIVFDATGGQPIRLTGSRPARFVATHSIEVNSTLNADGDDPNAPRGRAPGACLPSCQVPKPGDFSGAGHATAGEGPDPGLAYGTPELVPLENDAGSEGGFGTSGSGVVIGTGGGGAVELTTLGALEIRPDLNILIDASGADVSSADFPGAGSGGGILVRARSIREPGPDTPVQLEVTGGFTFGNAPSGSYGRIRLDVPDWSEFESVGLGPGGGLSETYGGPMLLEQPRITDRSQLTLNIAGEGEDEPAFAATISAPGTAMLGGDGDGEFVVSLTLPDPGIYRLCLSIPTGDSELDILPEASNCFFFARP